MIFKSPPENFNPKFEVVSCFCKGNQSNKLLLLHRQDHKPEGNTWGLPAGKVDAEENLDEAMAREVREETGYSLENINYFDKVYVRYPTYDFVYHMFHTEVPEDVEPSINPSEHKAYTWATPEEALQMNLIPDEDNCIKLFYNLA